MEGNCGTPKITDDIAGTLASKQTLLILTYSIGDDNAINSGLVYPF
jgi:hypothetical protein